MMNKIRNCVRFFLKKFFLKQLCINNSKNIKPKHKIPYEKIFISGGEPFYTYNSRKETGIEKIIRNATKIHKVTIVRGPSKSGKTVLVRKILPKDKAIWIGGGSINKEEEFWDVLVAKLKLYQSNKYSSSIENCSKNSISSKGGVEIPFFKTGIEAINERDSKNGFSIENMQQIYSKTSVI